MADPKEINLKALSSTPTGAVGMVASIDPTNPTIVHQHAGGSNDADLVTLLVCNIDAAARIVGVLIYIGSPTTANLAFLGSIPVNSGAYITLDGAWLNGGGKIGIYSDVANRVTYWGKAPKATLST